MLRLALIENLRRVAARIARGSSGVGSSHGAMSAGRSLAERGSPVSAVVSFGSITISPAMAEETAVDRDVRLAALTGSRLHLAHLSTAESIKILERAKKAGAPVTAEVTPHHLTMDHTLLETYDRNLKVNPPLRSEKDVAALRKALRSGTIDCIATDHAPHTDIDKQVEFNYAPPGMIGLQTAFALLHTELVLAGELELVDLVRLMTLGPAEVLGLPGGRLRVGDPADLVLVDPAEEWTLEAGMIRSISRNTPLIGRTFTGRVQGIFLEGSWRTAILE